MGKKGKLEQYCKVRFKTARGVIVTGVVEQIGDMFLMIQGDNGRDYIVDKRKVEVC